MHDCSLISPSSLISELEFTFNNYIHQAYLPQSDSQPQQPQRLASSPTTHHAPPHLKSLHNNRLLLRPRPRHSSSLRRRRRPHRLRRSTTHSPRRGRIRRHCQHRRPHPLKRRQGHLHQDRHDETRTSPESSLKMCLGVWQTRCVSPTPPAISKPQPPHQHQKKPRQQRRHLPRSRAPAPRHPRNPPRDLGPHNIRQRHLRLPRLQIRHRANAHPAAAPSGDHGWIVNVSSIFGLVGGRHNISYAASKGAVSNLTRQVAMDYAEARIHCNAICPGCKCFLSCVGLVR